MLCSAVVFVDLTCMSDNGFHTHTSFHKCSCCLFFIYTVQFNLIYGSVLISLCFIPIIITYWHRKHISMENQN